MSLARKGQRALHSLTLRASAGLTSTSPSKPVKATVQRARVFELSIGILANDGDCIGILANEREAASVFWPMKAWPRRYSGQ